MVPLLRIMSNWTGHKATEANQRNRKRDTTTRGYKRPKRKTKNFAHIVSHNLRSHLGTYHDRFVSTRIP
jgi:hypothetical protein